MTPAAAADARDRDYCEWETLNASCPADNEVIVVRRARYGRMRVGRCVGQSYGHIGCGSDVTDTLHRTCSGRRQCHVPVISLYNHRSCPKDFTSYLHAAYDCQPGDDRIRHDDDDDDNMELCYVIELSVCS